jgi:hypothetical protein
MGYKIWKSFSLALFMVLTSFTIKTDYWESINLQEDDIELIYNHLLEVETPLTVMDLASVLVQNRLDRERKAAETKRSEGIVRCW